MRELSRRGWPALLLLPGVFFLVASCGDGHAGAEENPDIVTSSRIDFDSLGGEIRIDGSSTVFPISEAVAEEFSRVADTRVNVGFSGTGGGFEALCRGDIDIANASRPFEEDDCPEGIPGLTELQVAFDALTVVVNIENDFVDCLTVQQLHDIFTDGGVSNWSEVNPEWPDEDIERYYPGTDSGTFDYFVEAILEEIDGEEAAHTGDGTASEDDNVLAQGVSGDANALGYFGFAFYQEAGQGLRSVPIDGGEGCVEPTLDTAIDGSYAPLSRPLFIYTTEDRLDTRPEMIGFVQFYLDNTNLLSKEVGYVPLPEDLLAEQQAKIEPFLP
ncbi:MAG TPA: PstS family phosphate ABC transporter substrate-binding protein [Dehalococcoidia bacterium]|nr:PstS family phosphate ABC transporter substrate-binding protein [Dehalococcoidia bacterium]